MPPSMEEDRALAQQGRWGPGDWAARLVHWPGSLPRPSALSLIAVGLAASWVAVYLSGGTGRLGPQWFYLPIILAAVRFGYLGAIGTAAIASVLAGPLMPLDVAAGTPQHLAAILSRAFFFLLIGVVIAALIDRVQVSMRREVELATAERDLAIRKAAVMATVSHEFRTPLTVIRGVAATLEGQDLVTEDGRPLLEGLTNAADRLDSLVAAVLTASEQASDAPLETARNVVLAEVLQRVTGKLRGLDADSRVQSVIAPGAMVIRTDGEALAQLLRHLVENALKFSPPGSPVRVWAEDRGSEARIHISDSGPGIDPSFLAHAFDPFTQQDNSASRQHEGLGIGLFAANKLAKRLGGSVTIAPYPERGTEAVITLPGAIPAPGDGRSPAARNVRS